jgi:hypothetical protein
MTVGITDVGSDEVKLHRHDDGGQDTRIVLRTGGADDPVVDHPGQPADYVHADGTVWAWHQRWRLVGGVGDGERMAGQLYLRLYDLVTP